MSRVYLVRATGTGTSLADAVRPDIPAGTVGVFYFADGQFLVGTGADLGASSSAVELTGADLEAACASFGIAPGVFS